MDSNRGEAGVGVIEEIVREAEKRAKILESRRRYEARNKATRCSPKRNAAKNEAYKNNPEQRAAAVARAKAWYKDNKERADANKRRYAIRHAVKLKANSRNKWLLRKYGITEMEWDEKFIAQGSKCACCGTTEPRDKWQTDHDHNTGQVRGILCVTCNSMVANHSSERLRLGADYVEYWAATHTTIP